MKVKSALMICVFLMAVFTNIRAYGQANAGVGQLAAADSALNPGMVSYTFRNEFQKDVPGTLDKIKALGIINIEFSSLFGQTASALRKMLDDRKMVCTSFGVTYPELVNNTAEVAANAKTLGAAYVRVAWVPHDDKQGFTIDDARKTVADFNKAGKLLKEGYGLTFCYHNHGYEFAKYEQGTLYDYIVNQTKPEYVSFELDVLWAFFGGADPAELIRKYPDRYRLMHVKDLKKGVTGDLSGKTATDNDVALGTGQVDIAAIIKAAKASSIKYYYIEDESNNTGQQVPISIAYLKKALIN